MSLLVACGDILDVDIIGDDFVINIVDKAIFDVVNKNENLSLLDSIFKSLNYDYKLVVNKKDKQEDLIQKDIDLLTKLVGSKLKIKG